MANMASPAADASKPQDVVPEKDLKSEVNGHTSPATETSNGAATKPKDEQESASDKPLPNGTAAADDTAAVNGSSPEKTPAPAVNGDKSDDSKPEQASTETKDEQKPADDSESKPAKDASEDVQMADSEPAKDTEDKKPAEEPKAEQPKEKEPVDTEMADKPSEEPATASATKDADAPLPTSEVDLHPASLSQLAIESTETEKSPAAPSTDVSMTDAPNAKVAREREDDDGEQPAPKRARTEPKEDEPAQVEQTSTEIVEESVEAAPAETLYLTNLPNWEDEEINKREITPHQRREVRKLLGRVKKTKQGAGFRDAVVKLWPVLSETYLAKTEKPMDLSELDRNIRDINGPYATVADFKKDLRLIYENSLAFNGAAHDVTVSAFGTVRTVWQDSLAIPAEEPAKPKPTPKPKPIRESRAVATTETSTKRQSAAPAANPPAAAAEVKVEAPPPAPKAAAATVTAATEEPPAALRRASTAEGDRPKRTVRAPKSKDIDYTTKPSRKKLKPELQFCEEVLAEVMHPKHQQLNMWFLEPVDAEGLGIPNYYNVIKKPMDMGKVSRMLLGGEISSLKDFEKNIKLIFSNCYLFNGPPDQGNPVSLVAKELEDMVNSLMKGKDAWLAKHAKANAPAASASNASDEEGDDDEEDEAEEPAAPGVDPSKEVRELEAKLREESTKLTDLFAADAPNQAMIQIQQGILTVVQEALLKAKQSLAEYRQKHDKPAKKASKSSKAKAAGGSTGRKATGSAAQPKKSGGSKKAAQKKTLTAADKDQIANAINDLDYPHLDRAIDIIKRDTGQAENNDGELELDIDQLSNEALLKLWELLKKVLPGFGKDSTTGNASPEVNRGAPSKQAPKSASSKSKKNKPMSAQEQEARIAQLQSLRDLYKGDQAPGQPTGITQAPTPTAESSDDSDSEEE